MARTHQDPDRLTAEDRARLAALLDAVSSHTLLKVLLDMEASNADAHLIIEVLLERLADDDQISAV